MGWERGFGSIEMRMASRRGVVDLICDVLRVASYPLYLYINCRSKFIQCSVTISALLPPIIPEYIHTFHFSSPILAELKRAFPLMLQSGAADETFLLHIVENDMSLLNLGCIMVGRC
jgi:hypothetical protein